MAFVAEEKKETTVFIKNLPDDITTAVNWIIYIYSMNYYNNYYSDYEQYLLDADVEYPSVNGKNSCVLNYKNATGCISSSNYFPLVSTTFYRNLKMFIQENFYILLNFLLFLLNIILHYLLK